MLGKHKAGRPKAAGASAGSKANVESLHCDQRVPVFSARCLARLLTAILNDGLAHDMEEVLAVTSTRRFLGVMGIDGASVAPTC